MAQVISRHNKDVSVKSETSAPTVRSGCNCQKGHVPCIMGGKCVEGNVVYHGTMTRLNIRHKEFYTGVSEPSWKFRYGHHKLNFQNDTRANRATTCLSKHIWLLKDKRSSIPEIQKASQSLFIQPSDHYLQTLPHGKIFRSECVNIQRRSKKFSASAHNKTSAV